MSKRVRGLVSLALVWLGCCLLIAAALRAYGLSLVSIGMSLLCLMGTAFHCRYYRECFVRCPHCRSERVSGARWRGGPIGGYQCLDCRRAWGRGR